MPPVQCGGANSRCATEDLWFERCRGAVSFGTEVAAAKCDDIRRLGGIKLENSPVGNRSRSTKTTEGLFLDQDADGVPFVRGRRAAVRHLDGHRKMLCESE